MVLCISPGVALIVCSAGGGSSLDVIVHFFFSLLFYFSSASILYASHYIPWVGLQKRNIYSQILVA